MAATQAEADRVLAAYENAKEAPAYVNSIKLQMSLIAGEIDDYRMVWTSQYPPEQPIEQ